MTSLLPVVDDATGRKALRPWDVDGGPEGEAEPDGGTPVDPTVRTPVEMPELERLEPIHMMGFQRVLASLRVAVGWTFLWAFLDMACPCPHLLLRWREPVAAGGSRHGPPTDPSKEGRYPRLRRSDRKEHGDMDATLRLLVIAVVWAAIGVAAAIFMGRRGHSPFAWLILGAVLGPLCIPVAVVAVIDERTEIRREVVGGQPGLGPVDILVGIDGSAESESALRTVGALFGARVGRLTLVSVQHFDVAGSGDPLLSGERTAQSLEKVAYEFGAQRPSAIILSGRPAETLIRYATEEDYELIAIGKRGRGASKAVMGSTATRLAHGAGVPVLIV